MIKNYQLILSILLWVSAGQSHASETCLGEIEKQVLTAAEAHVGAKGVGIRQSRITILHHYGCYGSEYLRCAVNSRVAVEDRNREWSYFSFQSSYATGGDCAVKSVTFKIVEGEAAEREKNADDEALLKRLGY